MFQKELSECEILVLEVIFLLFIKKKKQNQENPKNPCAMKCD